MIYQMEMQTWRTMRYQVIILILVMPLIYGEVCTGGFFSFKGSNQKQGFKLFTDVARSWDEAKKKCEDEGLTMAKPSDEGAVELRNYISKTFPNIPGYSVWLGARGTGTEHQWLDGTTLPSDHQLWHHGEPGSSTTIDDCLRMWVVEWATTTYEYTAYSPRPCEWNKFYTLCEPVNAEAEELNEENEEDDHEEEQEDEQEEEDYGGKLQDEENRRRRRIVTN